jgi:AcrR family transcriptional regulator
MLLIWPHDCKPLSGGIMDDRATDVKQELKRSRVKICFLQAAKSMISAKGVDSVTVRGVADAAGYTYPTLYNYFEDLNELLWETRRFMIRELVDTMRQTMRDPIHSADDIKNVFRAYMEYYLTNPNVFEFFYLRRLREPSKKPDGAEPDFGAMWNETLGGFVLSGRLREADIEAVAKICIYAMHGMLTLNFSNNGDLHEKANLYGDLDKMVDYLLK